MHELSIMREILNIAFESAAKHRLNKISGINVVVGDFSGVEPSALEFAFEYFTRDTPAQGSELTIARVGVTGHCRRCGVKMEGVSGLKCSCGKPPDYEMLTGMELYLDSITGESEQGE